MAKDFYAAQVKLRRYQLRQHPNDRATADVTIALSIRRARRMAGMTQAELAEQIGVTRSRLAQWETRHRSVPIYDYHRLREALPDLPAAKRIRSRHHEPVSFTFSAPLASSGDRSSGSGSSSTKSSGNGSAGAPKKLG